jgi:hypothetical protein
VTRETVNRLHKLPRFKGAVSAIVQEHREAQIGYLRELSVKAMGTLEDLLAYSDPNIRLKAAVAVLNLSGLDKASRAAADAKATAAQ